LFFHFKQPVTTSFFAFGKFILLLEKEESV